MAHPPGPGCVVTIIGLAVGAAGAAGCLAVTVLLISMVFSGCGPVPRCHVTPEGIEICTGVRCRQLEDGKFIPCNHLREPIGPTAPVGKIEVKTACSALHFDSHGFQVSCPGMEAR